jgi:poly-gamma-glutamate capsule biosynthesis protein CapA/YwtB (metallophosphatase superfamily)
MATEQDTTKPDAGLRPQTAAARKRSPEAARQRTATERERLREESRARRRARAEGRVFAPEPQADQITVRRLPEAPAASPPSSPPVAPPAPSPLRPSTPAGGAGGLAGVLPAPPKAPPPTERAAPSAPVQRPPLPRLPGPARERATLLLGLASAVGVVVCLAASIGSGGLPGLGGGMQAEASARAVAPGGWISVEGKDAPHDADLVLESRSKNGGWHAFAEGKADGEGGFELRGRVLERPGRVMLRARAGGAATTTPVAVTVRPLRLASVGDINLGDVPGEAIAAHGPDYPWQGTGKALKAADLAFGNLECAVSTRGEPFPKDYNFRATPAALAGLRRNSGIDVLNLANNHVGDYGPAATLDTVRGVERLGMKAVGAGRNLRRALAPRVVQRLGLRVAFVGFSEIAPLEFAAAPGRPGTAWARPEQIAAAVQAARRKADIVVATFHWGIEKQTLETARQRELAHVAVRSGAQVVLGAHPHTLQPVRRQGGAIVAYSLGNFVFGAQSPETSSTGILELDLTAEGVSRAHWRAAHISGGRPLLERQAPRRLPLRDSLAMEAGVNLPEL